MPETSPTLDQAWLEAPLRTSVGELQLAGVARDARRLDPKMMRVLGSYALVYLLEVDGYYRGARYHGAIQLLVEPTGRRLAGKWVGFGKQMDVNTGPWELTFQDASTSKATLARYDQPPAPADT